MTVDFRGTYAESVTDLNDRNKFLLCGIENAIIAFGEDDSSAKLALLRRVW